MAAIGQNLKKKPKYRKNKIEIVFNADKRREFLTGFHKRKLERKKKAQEKLVNEIKSEKKRLKQEVKESYKKFLSYKTIPLIENLESKEYDDDDVTVKVTELSTVEIAERNNWIGENRPQYETECVNTEEPNDTEQIPGMELKPPQSPESQHNGTEFAFRTEKDIKKSLKQEANRKLQDSKAFQQKSRIEQMKNRKMALKKKRAEQKKQKLIKKRGNKKKH